MTTPGRALKKRRPEAKVEKEKAFGFAVEDEEEKYLSASEDEVTAGTQCVVS